MPSPLSWTMPLAYPFLPDSAESTLINAPLPHHIESPLSTTAPIFQNTVSYPASTLPIPDSTNKAGQYKCITRKSRAKPEGKYLVPVKERCDVCKRDFFNLLGHKKSAHGLLKKPIECCGREFTTRQSLKEHKKSVCDFRNSW